MFEATLIIKYTTTLLPDVEILKIFSTRTYACATRKKSLKPYSCILHTQ